MMRRIIATICLVAVLLAGMVWIAAGLGPLGVLSLPFASSLVRVESCPCILDVAADAGAVDRTAFAQALQSYAAAAGFRPDDDDPAPPGTRRLASYTGPGTLAMLASAQTGRIAVQLFKDKSDKATYAREVDGAAAALEPLGLKRIACR